MIDFRQVEKELCVTQLVNPHITEQKLVVKYCKRDPKRAYGGGSRDQLYKIGLPGKSILGEYFQEDRTFRRPFLLLRISFPGRPIFIQLPPAAAVPTCPLRRLPLPHPTLITGR